MSLRGRSCSLPEAISNSQGDCFVGKSALLAMTSLVLRINRVVYTAGRTDINNDSFRSIGHVIVLMEYELDRRSANWNGWIIAIKDVGGGCLNIAVPYLFGKHDLSETQARIIAASVPFIMVPFQIDLRSCEDMPGLVINIHFHHITFKDQRPM